MKRPSKPPIGPEDKKLFLKNLAELGNAEAAARGTGYTRAGFSYHKKQDPDFAKAWEDAMEVAVDTWEQEVIRRGVHGVEKPVLYQGKVVGKIQEYSDRMLELLMSAHRPEKYGKNRVEMTGKDGKPLFNEHNKIEVARRLAWLLSQGAEAASSQDQAEPQAPTEKGPVH